MAGGIWKSEQAGESGIVVGKFEEGVSDTEMEEVGKCCSMGS